MSGRDAVLAPLSKASGRLNYLVDDGQTVGAPSGMLGTAAVMGAGLFAAGAAGAAKQKRRNHVSPSPHMQIQYQYNPYEESAKEADVREEATSTPVNGLNTAKSTELIGEEAGKQAHDINLGRQMISAGGLMNTQPPMPGAGNVMTTRHSSRLPYGY